MVNTPMNNPPSCKPFPYWKGRLSAPSFVDFWRERWTSYGYCLLSDACFSNRFCIFVVEKMRSQGHHTRVGDGDKKENSQNSQELYTLFADSAWKNKTLVIFISRKRRSYLHKLGSGIFAQRSLKITHFVCFLAHFFLLYAINTVPLHPVSIKR